MKVLHLIKNKPDDGVTKIIEAHRAGHDVKVIDLSKGEASYEEIVDKIFSSDRVISW